MWYVMYRPRIASEKEVWLGESEQLEISLSEGSSGYVEVAFKTTQSLFVEGVPWKETREKPLRVNLFVNGD